MASRVQDRQGRKDRQKGRAPGGSGGGNNSRAPRGSWKPVFAENADSDDDQFNENLYCIVCAERIVYASKSPCNHTTCHVCSFKQRALYEKKACLVCRTENEDLIITEQRESDYQTLKPLVKAHDDKYAVSFTSSNAHVDTMALLNYSCAKCPFVGNNYNELFDHLKFTHDRYLCTLCSSHKKAFPYQLAVYSQKQLQTHLIRGDQNDENFKGHPICNFCKGKRFYSTDELNLHYRTSHEECHVCKSLDSQNPQYFKNYDSLEEHFKTDHYICSVPSCLERKFVVFADEFELHAHFITEHPTMYGTNHVYGTSSNKMHSKLSTFAQPKKQQARPDEAVGSVETKRMRLEERARHYANYDTAKFNEFKELNTTFHNGHITAEELKDAYTQLFKSNSMEELNLLLFDLLETLNKNTSKYSDLSNVVSKQRQILDHKDDQIFPALSNSSSSLDMAASWVNTAGTTKKQQGRQNLIDNFPPLRAPPKNRPPPSKPPVNRAPLVLRQPNKKKTIPQQSQVPQKPKTPVVSRSPSIIPNYLESSKAANSSTSSLSSTSSSFSSSAKPTKKPAVQLSDSLFPTLQAAPKRVIPRVNPIPQGNGQWDTGPVMSSASSSVDDFPTMQETTSKKGKKKKQILFQMGGRM